MGGGKEEEKKGGKESSTIQIRTVLKRKGQRKPNCVEDSKRRDENKVYLKRISGTQGAEQ